MASEDRAARPRPREYFIDASGGEIMSNKNLIVIAAVVGLIVVVAMVYALGSGAPQEYMQLRTLDSRAARWQTQNITSYDMKVHIGCFCPFFDRMPLTVQVRDGQVVSVVDSQGQPVAADDPIRMYGNEQLMTIDGVFAYAREAIREADETTITYDPALGFPLALSIDRIKLAMDDELGVTISDLRALE
jgi:hypothetical protein